MAITGQTTTHKMDPKFLAALQQGLDASGLGDRVKVTELTSAQQQALFDAVQSFRRTGSNTNHGDVLASGELDGLKAERAFNGLRELSEEVVLVDLASILKLFGKLAQNRYEGARLQRSTALASQVVASETAISKMKDASEKRFTASCIQGGMQIAGGAVQIGAGVVAMRDSVQGARQDLRGKDLLADADKLKKLGMTDSSKMDLAKETSLTKQGNSLIAQGVVLSARGTAVSGGGQGASSLFSGIGTIASAGVTREADGDDQEKAKLDLLAKKEETRASQAQDSAQQAMETVHDVREKLQSIQQSTSQVNSLITRNMA